MPVLYIMRHGQAVSAEGWRQGDGLRPLTRDGEEDVREASAYFKKGGFEPKTILSSPLKRTRQTADLVAEAGVGTTPVPVPELAAGARAETIRGVLIQPEWQWPLLYIGHMPDVALFASRLTGEASWLETSVAPAEILAFETQPLENGWGQGKLLWRRQINEWTKLNTR